MRSLSFALIVVAATLSGCPSYTAIPEHQRVEIEKTHAGEIRWLKQSMFAGVFYDDDRFELISAIPFERVTVLRSLDGEIMTPPPAEEILPAGTKVRIERIGFPTGREVFRRPLYTPRYTTWVVMRVAASRGETHLERARKHVLLLPTFLKDETEFDTWLDASLAKDDPNPWLRSLEPNVREGIFNKRAALGMTYDALTSALGYPDRVTRTQRNVTREGRSKSITVEVAIFGATSVVLEEGTVVRVSDPAAGLTLETPTTTTPEPSNAAPATKVESPPTATPPPPSADKPPAETESTKPPLAEAPTDDDNAAAEGAPPSSATVELPPAASPSPSERNDGNAAGDASNDASGKDVSGKDVSGNEDGAAETDSAAEANPPVTEPVPSSGDTPAASPDV